MMDHGCSLRDRVNWDLSALGSLCGKRHRIAPGISLAYRVWLRRAGPGAHQHMPRTSRCTGGLQVGAGLRGWGAGPGSSRPSLGFLCGFS